jgi:hypothetical protein
MHDFRKGGLQMDTDFDFQDWAQLAKLSPEAFEARRQEAIAAFLAGSSAEHRRLGHSLQREIDFEIRRAGSPQLAFAAIAKMMRDQMDFLCEEMLSLNSALTEFDALTRSRAAALKAAAAAVVGAEAEPQPADSRGS